MKHSNRMHISPIIVLLLGLATTSLAQDENQKSEKIRAEYRGIETPIFLVYKINIDRVAMVNGKDPNRAIELVRQKMHFDDANAAEPFLELLLAAHASSQKDEIDVKRQALCGNDLARHDESVYQRMDALDDSREAASRSQYQKFVAKLDQDTRNKFDNWLSEFSAGVYYVKSKHDGLFDNSGIDVASTVDNICIELAAEE